MKVDDAIVKLLRGRVSFHALFVLSTWSGGGGRLFLFRYGHAIEQGSLSAAAPVVRKT